MSAALRFAVVGDPVAHSKSPAMHRAALTKLDRDLHELGRDLVGGRAPELRELAARLDAMSPLKVLGRGYAIATLPDGRAVRDAAALSPGDALRLGFARGSAVVTVDQVVAAPEAD